MLVTLLGIMVLLHPTIKVFVLVSIIALQLFLLSYLMFPDETEMPVKPLQPLNAEEPILFTLSGMTMFVKPLQSSNAALQINLVSLAISQFP